MPEPISIRRALISVYDKTGIVDFARSLHEEFGVEIISTGGTAKTLTDAGIPVTLVEKITGFPEMLDGRVKTLHPKIHAAILADRDNPEHMRQLIEQGIAPIDMVVVNLYPFEKTIADPNCTFEQAIEMIDIGGPCLLRAAAKNHKHVLVADDPDHYDVVLSELRRGEGGITPILHEMGANFAFDLTAHYDSVVSRWISRHYYNGKEWFERLRLTRLGGLRYGENPHQSADMYFLPEHRSANPLVCAVRGTHAEVSFNNYADASAALALCAELTRARTQLGDRPPAGQASRENGGPTSGRSITDEQFTRRHLPHIERPEATYFITFRLRRGELSPPERDLALSACTFWHGRKMTLHCACVMPNHVHLLLTPLEQETGRWVPLGELLKSIKSYSASRINRTRGAQGSLWLDENFDRIIRNEHDFHEKWDYICHNPVTAGIVNQPEEYHWFWQSGSGYGELAALNANDRPEAGPPKAGPPCSLKSLSAACFVKHTNACGIGIADEPIEAYRRAYLGDPNAAMGGILAVNFNVGAGFAEAVMESLQRWGKAAGVTGRRPVPQAFFVEVWVAPAFDEDAIQIIRTRKKWGERVRLLDVGDMTKPPDADEMDIKSIAGGVLMQTRDLVGLNEDQWKVVTQREPTEAEMNNLRLAWLICKHTKSNAISICSDGMLIGNGAGQMSRVMSCRIATWLAKENGHENQLKGAAAASDAFFPFSDGPEILADAGVSALIQPGGSKRDQQVIDACNQRGVAMIFTGTRHFKH